MFNYAILMHLFYKLAPNVLEVVNLLCLLGIKEFCIFCSVHYTPSNGYKIHKNIPLLLIVLYRVHRIALLGDHAYLPVSLFVCTFFCDLSFLLEFYEIQLVHFVQKVVN
jgi:hypothetical protein